MLWCSAADVMRHLGGEQTAKGYDPVSDPTLRIIQAENLLRPALVALLDATTVAGWKDSGSVPPLVSGMAAIVAAAYMLQDFGGQSVDDSLSKAGSLWTQIWGKAGVITLARQGDLALIDVLQEPVSGTRKLAFSSSRLKTPAISMGNEGDGSTGTIDNF